MDVPQVVPLFMETAKKLIGFILSWILFICGNVFYFIMECDEHTDMWVEFWYPLCRDTLLLSSSLQNWGGIGPWK